MDDREIIEQVKNGDTDAFGLLVERYQDRVYNLALRMSGSEEDANDLAQEAFFRAWRSLGAFQFDSAFSTWLFRLTHNLCIDHLRSRRRKPTVSLTLPDDDGEAAVQYDPPDPAPDPEQALMLLEDRRLLTQALAALPADYREILTLRAIEDLSYGRIAELLQIREGTVKSRLSRARAQLRNILLQIGNNSAAPSSNSAEGRMRDDL